MGTIGIINYGMGNIRSVFNALEHIGETAVIVEQPEQMEDFSHLILPGVGAYSEAMKNIRHKGFIQGIMTHVNAGKPFLGICLGMQLLSTEGDEFVPTAGLGIIPGKVQRLDVSLHIPHVGWNNIALNRSHPVFQGVKSDIDFYFVHSYCFNVQRPEHLLATVDYERAVPCAVTNGASAIGVQFHPEKSQENGLKILENFCAWDGSRPC